MHAISAKELRTKFPFVRSELAKGTTFLVIYQSKPIAQLKPMDGVELSRKEENLEDWRNAGAQEWAKLPPITKEEHDYYMSLPRLKDE